MIYIYSRVYSDNALAFMKIIKRFFFKSCNSLYFALSVEQFKQIWVNVVRHLFYIFVMNKEVYNNIVENNWNRSVVF